MFTYTHVWGECVLLLASVFLSFVMSHLWVCELVCVWRAGGCVSVSVCLWMFERVCVCVDVGNQLLDL